jgi:hypothetical protein
MTKQPLSDAGKAVEDLLPFYAAGVLTQPELSQVERVLAVDAELRRRLALVEEEQTEAILLNEGIAGPSSRALDKLMAAIEAEPRRASAHAVRAGLVARLGGWLQALTPQQMGLAAAMGALVLALQAGALVGLMAGRDGGSGFQTASHGNAPVAAGPALTVIFQPDARAADIAALMERVGVRIVDGPRVGGLYRVELTDRSADAAAAAARLRAEAALIRLVSPAS